MYYTSIKFERCSSVSEGNFCLRFRCKIDGLLDPLSNLSESAGDFCKIGLLDVLSLTIVLRLVDEIIKPEEELTDLTLLVFCLESSKDSK